MLRKQDIEPDRLRLSERHCA